MITFLIGIKLQPPVVGRVVPDSPAARAGLKAGDEIIEIAGKKNDLDFPSIGIAAALSDKDEKVPLKVRHPDGTEEEIFLVAELLPNRTAKLFGVMPAASLTVAKLPNRDPNNLFAKTGLLPGDRIISVDGRDIRGHWEFVEMLGNALEPEVTLSVERIGNDGKTEMVETRIPLNFQPVNNETNSDYNLGNICSMVPRLRITGVSEVVYMIANGADTLHVGDIILAAGDINNPTYKELRDITTEYKDKELHVKILRIDQTGTEVTRVVTVLPRHDPNSHRIIIGINLALDIEHPVVADTISFEDGLEALKIPSGAKITAVDGEAVSNYFDIIREIKRYPDQRITLDWRLDEETAGSVALDVSSAAKFIDIRIDMSDFDIIPFEILETTYRADGPIDAVVMGYRRTVMFITQTYVTLNRLVRGLVSPKNLWGPVGIIKASYDIVSERPMVYYVYFLGLISAVIAVFNFLPLPPLDGGLVVLLLIEKIKGSALSERVQTIIAYTGWLLILTLFLYVTFNDIVRSFFSPALGS